MQGIHIREFSAHNQVFRLIIKQDAAVYVYRKLRTSFTG